MAKRANNALPGPPVTPADIVRLSRQLIAIPSTADKPAEHKRILQMVGNILSAAGATIEYFSSHGKPSLLAYAGPHRPDKFKVLLNGHLDVVPASSTLFAPKCTSNRLYGRGALDMKTAVACQIAVFVDVIGRANEYNRHIGIQIVCDEESSGADGTAYQLKQGVATELAIVGERTPRSSLCSQSRGFAWITAEFKGQAAHGAYPWQGQNAILKAMIFLQKLMDYYPVPKQAAWTTTINPANITTPNNAFNIVPDTARLNLDCRFTPADSNFANTKALLKLLCSIDDEAVYQVKAFEPCHSVDTDHPLVRQLAQALQEVTGQLTTFEQRFGAADLRYFTAACSQAIGFGLQGQNPHAENEWVSLRSIDEYCRTLRLFFGIKT